MKDIKQICFDYNHSKKGSTKRKEYYHSKKGQIVYKKAEISYNNSEKGKSTRRNYAYSKEGEVTKNKYLQSEKGRLACSKHQAKRKRELGFIPMFSNPFDSSVLVDYHHITDIYVVAIPRDLHRLYLGKNHRENTMEIVKQIYLGN